ncbi:proline-rich protein 36 isoform X1 [Euwallacea similis]|uniref:proline-rich protein 36 isoform X1 n=1 Tax=Euwallacea similis TaxID=1736056 RepID=UPI00344EC804
MVCKEEVLTWFKDLDSFKRIDILCELINMCLPFELRFLGSYVEETGKHSCQELRQQALSANDVDKLEKDPSLKNQTLYDENIRHRMLLNVSLLKSRNYNVANWYSKKFLRTDYVEELVGREKDDVVQTELLLLFTMASRHPAFNFEHKQFYNRIVTQLYELRERSSRFCTHRYPPGFEYPNVCRNIKAHDSIPFTMGVPIMHPPGLPPHYMGHFRTTWPGMNCGAPPEIPPFSHQAPLQPTLPPTSPLVSSPNQSRSGSPRSVSRPPTFSMVTSSPSTATMPPVNPPGVVPPGHPAAITTPLIMACPGTTGMSTLVPIDALAPPASLGQSNQHSPILNQLKCASEPENDELNSTLKGESPQKGPPPKINPWMNSSLVNPEGKQINGLRIAHMFPPPVNVRTSIADQMQPITDEGSHYHSSSSSSPLQTPPETPSNLAPTPPNRAPLEKNRVNGLPNFLPPFGDTTSPPPPAFTFPAFTPMGHRYFNNPGYRPPVTTVFGQFAPNQAPFQGTQPSGPDSAAPSYHTVFTTPAYVSVLYSSYPPNLQHPPAAPVPPRNHPLGCYNCGASNHLGQECPQQNIDDITQKNTYSVDFSPGTSDTEK